MSSPRPAGIRLSRPYDSEDAFIRGDGLAIGRLGMILMGAPKRAPGVVLRFDIVLASGQVVFRGEGRVIAHRVHASGRQGLEVRFTRLDAASKAIVEKVLQLRQQGALSLHSMLPTAASSLAPPPMPIPRTSGVEAIKTAISSDGSEAHKPPEDRLADQPDEQASNQLGDDNADESTQDDEEYGTRDSVDSAMEHTQQRDPGTSPAKASPVTSLKTSPDRSTSIRSAKGAAKITSHELLDVDAALSTLRERGGTFEPPESTADYLARLRDRGSRGHQSNG